MTTTANQVRQALEPFGLKAEGHNRFRSNVPWRDGSNSHALTVTFDDDGEHGAYFDHVAEESGSLYELAAKLGLEPDKRVEVASTKRAYRNMADYAAAHGLTYEQLATAGWQDSTAHGRTALTFTTKTGMRWRFLDGKSPVYVNSQGYKAAWYYLEGAALMARQANDPLVLTNGEISVVSAQVHGIPATCITGGSERVFPPELMQKLRNTHHTAIIVALDCDHKGRDAAPKLVQALREAGYQSVKAIDLGLSQGGDLADFCKLYGDEARQRLSQCRDLNASPTSPTSPASLANPTSSAASPDDAVKEAKQPAPLITWIRSDEVAKVPPIDWLIPNELPERSLVVLFGPPGAGKSFVALDYSLTVAQTGAALYVASEGFAGYADRVLAWTKWHRKSGDNLWFASGNQVLSLLNPDTAKQLLLEIAPMKPRLIVLDTLAWAMLGGDENSVKDMQRLISHCRYIQEQTGATVLLVHHTAKSGNAERGSSALRGGADLMIEVTADDNVITLSCSKVKDAEPFPNRYLKPIRVQTRDMRTSLVWVTSHDPAPPMIRTARLARHQRDLLEMLNSPVFVDNGARMPQLCDALPQISRRHLYRALNRLMDKRIGYVAQETMGTPFKITEAGKSILAGHVLPDVEDSEGDE